MLGSYAAVGVMLAIVLTIPIGGYVVTWLLRPKRAYPLKQDTYECGLETTGDTWVQFKVQYYIFALIFVVFDIETVFIYPWAVAYKQIGLFAWLERKIIGRIQDRLGPNRVGPLGLLQPVADMVKLFTKEFIIPRNADKVIYYLAPVIFVIPAFLVFAVIPFSSDAIIADLNIGWLYIVAIGSTSTIALLMAGWSSNNKYALLGGM